MGVKTLYKFYLARQKRAFYVRRLTVNRIDRHDCHFARCTKREPDQIDSRDTQFCILTIGRDAHDTAPATYRSRDVKISFVIKRKSLRAAQTLEEDIHLAIGID